MGSNHITEEDIQNYLDHNPLSNEKSFHFHLERCEHCQNCMAEYRRLYGDLKREPDIRFSEDFAANVASRIHFHVKTRSRPFISEQLLGISGFIAALIATFFFLDWKSVLGFLTRIALLKIHFNLHSFESVKLIIAGLNGHLYLIFFAVLTLCIVEVLDRFILRTREYKIWNE